MAHKVSTAYLQCQPCTRLCCLVKCTMFGDSHANVTNPPLLVHGGSRTAEGLFLCCSTFITAASSNGSSCFGSNSTELLRFGALLREAPERGASCLYVCLFSLCLQIALMLPFRFTVKWKLESMTECCASPSKLAVPHSDHCISFTAWTWNWRPTSLQYSYRPERKMGSQI